MKKFNSFLLFTCIITIILVGRNVFAQQEVCLSPAITATVNGNRSFKSCDADAHTVLSWLNYYGTSGKDIIGFNFSCSPKEIKPGSYKIIKGIEKSKSQKWSINAIYYQNGSSLKHQYQSIRGTITLTVADGKNYKGTFDMDVQQKDTKEILHITNGKFDLEFHEVSNYKLKGRKKK